MRRLQTVSVLSCRRVLRLQAEQLSAFDKKREKRFVDLLHFTDEMHQAADFFLHPKNSRVTKPRLPLQTPGSVLTEDTFYWGLYLLTLFKSFWGFSLSQVTPDQPGYKVHLSIKRKLWVNSRSFLPLLDSHRNQAPCKTFYLTKFVQKKCEAWFCPGFCLSGHLRAGLTSRLRVQDWDVK